MVNRNYFFALILACMASLGTKAQDASENMVCEKTLLELRKDMPDKTVAMNPVTDFDCPDPSIVQIDGWFYCFKTGFPIKIYRSRTCATGPSIAICFLVRTRTTPLATASSTL